MYRNNKIALVIPAHNEEKLIKPTLQEVPKLIDKIYIINDASNDRTAQIVKNCAKKDKRINLIQHKKNRGVGQAIITGYNRAIKDNNDIAVVIGGDHQMPLNEIKRFLIPLINDKADYVKGNRFMLEGNAFENMPKIRLLGNTLISLLTKISSGYYKIFDVVDGYTAINQKALKTVDWKRAWKRYGYPMDFLIRLNAYGLRVKDVPRTAIYRQGTRQSQIKPLRYTIKVIPILIKGFFWRLKKKYIYSDFHPLVFLYAIGIIFFPLGILFGLFLAWKEICCGGSGPGSSMLATLMITIGIQSIFFAMLFDMQEGDRLTA